MTPSLAPGAEQLVLLLTAGFAASLLLQQLFAWTARAAVRLQLWVVVWAGSTLAWCVARSLEVALLPTSPALAGRWTAFGLAALLPLGAGLVGAVGMARQPLLSASYGRAAAALCTAAGVLVLAIGGGVSPRLAVRLAPGGASYVLHDPGPVVFGTHLLYLLLLVGGCLHLLRRQPMEAALRGVLAVGVLAFTLAQANDLLAGTGRISSAPLTAHGLLVLGVALTALVAADARPRPEALAPVLALHRRSVAEQNRLLADALADAREAGLARHRFLARMSHELRTPLHGVIGMTELALDTRLDEAQRRYLEQARASAEQLLALVDDVLDLARIDAGRVELAREPFPLRPLLEDCLRVVGAQAARKGLELVLAAPEELPVTLVGDRLRLRQVLVNLLGNAVKFTEAGEVALRARPTAARNGRLGVRFEVVDTGPGIPAEEQAHILEPFMQGAAGEGRGSGLGLAICRELVERMGGTLQVDSAPGRGSTFAFELMLGIPEVDQEITLVDPILLQGLPVLVAEDHPATAEGILQELGEWRMMASAVADGRSALQALRDARAQGRPYPLLLLDADMPELDGWAVLEVLAQEPGLVGATVFMLPAGAVAERYHKSRALGARATLGKPVRAAELLEAVLAAIGPSLSDPDVDTDPATDPKERLRVLVADDQAVNRELVAGTLAMVGAEVVLVEDGEAAVKAALSAEPFDLVLMDVRMPGMDGQEATRRIRAAEAKAGRARVPIVAVTAHAMPGDRERLLSCGMDGVLTKPLRRQALFEVLDRYRVSSVPPDPADPSPRPVSAPTGEGAIDPDRLDAVTGGDLALARELMRLMLDELPHHRERLLAALDRQDPSALVRAAHALRGAAGNVGAVLVHQGAGSLEEAGRDADLALARHELPQLLGALDQLEAALQRLQAE